MEAGIEKRSWLKRYWVLWFILAPFGVLFIVWLVALCLPVSLQPGPETTVISEPLRPDGKIDYAAALTVTYSEGVTFKNNAAVPLLQIFGARRFEPVVWREYVRQLGLNDDFPKEYLLLDLKETFQGTKSELRDIEDQQELASNGPWKREDFPEIAKWLDANAKALAVARMAAKRETFFLPILSFTNREFYWDEAEIDQPFRILARLFAAESHLELANGRIEQALANTEVVHKLARLLSQHPRFMTTHSSLAIQSTATRLDGHVARCLALSFEDASKQRRMLEALSPFPESSSFLNTAERFNALDQIQYHGLSKWDINAAMKAANAIFDGAVHTQRTAKPLDRNAAWGTLKQRLIQESLPNRSAILKVVMFPRSTIGRWGGEYIAAPFSVLSSVDENRQARHLLSDTCYALAEYRIENGRYPQQLADLQPDFLRQLPIDPFGSTPDSPLRYVVDANSERFLLYSVGVNGVDDGGKREQAFDDIVSGESF